MQGTVTLNIMLLVIILFGLVGTLVPSLPGTGIILAGAVLHALLTEFNPLAWPYLLALTLVCLVGYFGQYLIAAITCRKMGASKYGVWGACLGMVVGFILPLPGGIFVGAFLGAVAGELFFDLKDLREAAKSGAGALFGTILALFFEFVVGLGMAIMIFYLFFVVTF